MDKPFAYYIESNATPGECWEFIEGREPVEYVGDDAFTIRPLYDTTPARAEAQDEGAAGEPNALPIDLAPRDGTILRLRVRYKAGVKGVWTPLEDAEESWTIGFNSLDNTGEDRWQFVGWDWSQDYLLEAPGGEVIGWLPFHGEQARPSPPPAADADSVREALTNIDFNLDPGEPEGSGYRLIGPAIDQITEALAALKSEGK